MNDVERLYLTLVDTSGIQDYVFSSNALKHQVGASELVHACTNEWIYKILKENQWHTNLINNQINSEKQIISDNLDVELIYNGGGNALLLFKELPNAKLFAHDLSLKAAKEADGLQVIITHHPFTINESFIDAMDSLLEKMFQKKRGRVRNSPLLGMGVTSNCLFSGLPAVEHDDSDRLISRQIQQKMKAFSKADTRLKSIIRDLHGYDFLYEMNQLGEEGDRYMAIVHADGNGMSDRNRSILVKYGSDYRNYITKMREFAESIKKASEVALNAVYDFLVNATSVGLVEPVDSHLPFRPIVFGGDDNTFVCVGNLGIRLATLFIQTLANINLSDGEPISERAGIAIVKTHYPFSRAYQLAEDLCTSAGEYRKQNQNTVFSAVDWHIATTGPVQDLEEIRALEFISDDSNNLCMRPVHINSEKAGWRSWENVEDMLHEFNKNFGRGNNKLKEMREFLRYGEAATKIFINTHPDAKFPEIPGLVSAPTDGWQNHTCCYFDAIELLDYYRDLEVFG